MAVEIGVGETGVRGLDPALAIVCDKSGPLEFIKGGDEAVREVVVVGFKGLLGSVRSSLDPY